MRIDFKGGRLGYSPDYFREFYFNLAKFLREEIIKLEKKKEKLQTEIENLEKIYKSLRLREISYSLMKQIEILLHLSEELSQNIQFQNNLAIYERFLETIQRLEDDLKNLKEELEKIIKEEISLEQLIKSINEIEEIVENIKKSPFREKLHRTYELFKLDEKFLSYLIIEIMTRISQEEVSSFSENLQEVFKDPYKNRIAVIPVPMDPEFLDEIGLEAAKYFFETFQIRAEIIPQREGKKIKEVKLILEDKTNEGSNRIFVILEGDNTSEPKYFIYMGKFRIRDELKINLEGLIPENFFVVNKFAKFIIVVIPEE